MSYRAMTSERTHNNKLLSEDNEVTILNAVLKEKGTPSEVWPVKLSV